WREDRPELGEGVVAIMGSGEFSPILAGPDAEVLVDEEYMRHVSVDIAPSRMVLLDAETKEEVSEEEIDFEVLMKGCCPFGMEGEIVGATICAFSAFAGAHMWTVRSEPDAMVASAGVALRIIPK